MSHDRCRPPLLLAVLVAFAAGCDHAAGERAFTFSLPWIGSAANGQAGLAAGDTVVAVARKVPVDTDALGIDVTAAIVDDGARVATTDWMTGDAVIRELATGQVTRITENTSPLTPEETRMAWYVRVSPDGQRAAYVSAGCNSAADPPCSNELKVQDLDGGEPITLAPVPGSGTPIIIDWSPDGRWLLSVVRQAGGATDLVLAPTDGGEHRVIRSFRDGGPRMAAFSPDGRHVAFDVQRREDSDDRDVHLVAVDGSGAGALVEGDSDDWLLGWSPDGFVAFSSDRGGTPGIWRIRVANGRVSGSPELVKPDIWRISPLGFQADGSLYYLAYTRSRDVHLAAMDPSTGRVAGSPTLGVAQGIGGTEQPVWSPDGRHMAYRVQKSPSGAATMSRWGLMVRSMETGETRELRVPAGIEGLSTPRWMPDGRAILVRAQHDQGRTTLLRVGVQTGQVERVWESADLWPTYHVLPDGRHIVLTEDIPASGQMPGGGERIALRSLDDWSAREISRHVRTGPQRAVVWHMAMSRDGQRLAFVEAADPALARLVVTSIDGGDRRVLITEEQDGWMPAWGNIASLAWTPDGSALLFARPGDDRTGMGRTLWRIDPNGGEPEQIGNFPDGIISVQVHPDSRRIAFVSGSAETELWVLESLDPVRPRPAGGQR